MNKSRIKFLQKIAQSTISGSPSSITFINSYPAITNLFGPNILKLTNYLNSLLYYSSPNKYSLQNLFNNPTSIPVTSIADQNLKKIILFCQEFLSYIKLSIVPNVSKELALQYIDRLLQSQNLNTISNVNVKGQLAQQVPGNPKTEILNYLREIKNSISATGIKQIL